MKKKPKTATILDLQAGLDVSPDETHIQIELRSTNKMPLPPQVVLDAVVDMISEYYGVSKEEWEAMADDKNELDS